MWGVLNSGILLAETDALPESLSLQDSVDIQKKLAERKKELIIRNTFTFFHKKLNDLDDEIEPDELYSIPSLSTLGGAGIIAEVIGFKLFLAGLSNIKQGTINRYFVHEILKTVLDGLDRYAATLASEMELDNRRDQNSLSKLASEFNDSSDRLKEKLEKLATALESFTSKNSTVHEIITNEDDGLKRNLKLLNKTGDLKMLEAAREKINTLVYENREHLTEAIATQMEEVLKKDTSREKNQRKINRPNAF